MASIERVFHKITRGVKHFNSNNTKSACVGFKPVLNSSIYNLNLKQKMVTVTKKPKSFII